MIADCDLGPAYKQEIDRESAYEILSRRAEGATAAANAEAAQAAEAKAAAKAARSPRATPSAPAPRAPARAPAQRVTPIERAGTRVATGVVNTLARELMRGILGTPRRRR
jgi:hypothetical protein